MEYKDYYLILGVDRKASEADIKRSYRKLALHYHPDHNLGNRSAEEKIKEINEAYQVLGDPVQRARYDQLGASYQQWQQRGAGASGGFNWDEWSVSQEGAAAGGRAHPENHSRGESNGKGEFSEFFRRIFGGAAAKKPPGKKKGKPAGAFIQQEMTITLQEAYSGATRRLDIDSRRVEVTIPPGAKTGTRVRIPNAIVSPLGHQSDLYLLIHVADVPGLERQGSDLHTDLKVDLYTAVLGGEIAFPILGGTVALTIPPGTQPGQVFRLAQKGMPLAGAPGVYGDLFVRIKVRLPRNLSARQRELFEELSRSK